MKSKNDSSISFLLRLSVADPSSIQNVLDNAGFAGYFLSDLTIVRNEFLNHLSSTLNKYYCSFIIYKSSPMNETNYLFLEKSNGKDIVSTIKDIPLRTLFSITLSEKFLDKVIEKASTSKAFSPLEIYSRNDEYYSYFLSDIIKSIQFNNTYKKLKLRDKKEIIDFLLSTALIEKMNNKLSNVIFANAVMCAQVSEPDITAKWVSTNIANLSSDPALFKIIVSGIVGHFRTKHSLAFLIFKSAIQSFQPYEFNSLLGGHTALEHQKIEGMNEHFCTRGRTFDIKTINILEQIIQNSAARKRDVPDLINTLIAAQDNGYFISPELTVKAILRNELVSFNHDILSSVVSMNDLNDKQKDWLKSQIKMSGYNNFNNAISAVLENPTEKSVKSNSNDIEGKLEFLLDLAGDDFEPSNHTLASALSSNIKSIVHKLFPLRNMKNLKEADWDSISRGIDATTSDDVLSIAVVYLEPLMKIIKMKDNAENNIFISMKNLLSVKRSLSKLASIYFNKIIVNDNEQYLIEKISGKKQLSFFLSAFNTDPYSLLTRDINEKINKLCIEIIASP
jgi:hypothetical protein